MDTSSDFSNYVTQNRVFILGAGFSASAGVPLTDQLLTDALGKFSDECPGIYSRVENYAKAAIGESGEDLDLSKLTLLNFAPSLST